MQLSKRGWKDDFVDDINGLLVATTLACCQTHMWECCRAMGVFYRLMFNLLVVALVEEMDLAKAAAIVDEMDKGYAGMTQISGVLSNMGTYVPEWTHSA